MNAHALLTSQGWRGSGHSLHPTSDQTGLSRPLLVSKKQNNQGVGKKQHSTSDQWWMNAFDKSLKGLDTSQEGKVVQTEKSGGLDLLKKGGVRFAGVGNGGGLYASFVKGESLEGTITPEDMETKTVTRSLQKEERSRETKEERRARKEAKRAARARHAFKSEETIPAAVEKVEDKEEKVEESIETREQRRERRKLMKLQSVKVENAVENSLLVEGKKKKKRRKE